MKRCLERLYNGLIKENPTFVLMLGMCPTLAVTTSAINGLGMGLSTMVVLALSNMIISALRKIIPDKVRIPAYIVIIATFVTIVELLMHAFVPSLYSALGIYISLIVVNCIILGRAESYASKNPVFPSLFDGIGMGLGFTMALTLIGLVREFLGAGTVFGFSIDKAFGDPLSVVTVALLAKVISPSSKGFLKVINDILTIELSSISPIGILVMAPGAFFVLATLTMIQNVIKDKGAKAGKDTSKIGSGCSSDCMNCSDMGCARRMVDNTVSETPAVETPAAETSEAKDKKDSKKKDKKEKISEAAVKEDEASVKEDATEDKTAEEDLAEILASNETDADENASKEESTNSDTKESEEIKKDESETETKEEAESDSDDKNEKEGE